MSKSQEIHDMIQTCQAYDVNRVLDILDKMNKRMDEIERELSRTANTASCLANGIKPD